MTLSHRLNASVISGESIRILLLLSATLFSCASSWASITTVYVGQSTAGGGDGSSCANQLPVSFFNSGANWGNGASQIGPGTTVHLCGNITTAMVAQGNGSASSPVTVVWESGASLNVCNTIGAFQMSGSSYFVLDLGGNTAAITCANNGTNLATKINAIGIGTGGNALTHTEIRNGTIGPLYQYACCGSDGIGSVSIYIFGATNNHFHDLTLQDTNAGIVFLLGNGISSAGNEINNNNCASTVGRCIDYSNADGSAVTDTAGQIHDNDITFGNGWYSGSGDYTHLESIRSFNYGGPGSQDHISGLLIYNNYLHGTVTGDATSFIFLPEGLSSCSSSSTLSAKVFNNLFVMTGGSGPGDGFIFTQDCEHTLEIYNNTFDAGNNTIGICMELEGANTVTFKNNICMNVMTMIYNADSTPTLTADFNSYYNVGSHGSNGWYWGSKEYQTLSSWQSATGNDSHSFTANPGLNPDYTVPAGAQAAGVALNLTSLGVSQMDTGKPVAVGPGLDGTLGSPRSGSGNWDLGAYAVLAGNQPAPPSGLAATVQ
jgi:hypothetical protein